MRYALAPYIGTGQDDDPFRPQGTDGVEGWSAIDLRPDPTKPDGRALVAAEVVPAGEVLGDDPNEPLPGPVRAALANRLGVTMRGQSVFLDRASAEVKPRPWSIAALAVELLRDHATPPGDRTRWNALRAGHDGMMRVFLGGELWKAPVVEGLVIADPFDRPDTTNVDSGGPVDWSEVFNAADWEIQGNRIVKVTGSGLGCLRAEPELASSDHYAQLDVVAKGVSASARAVAPAARMHATNETYYLGQALYDDDTGANQLFRLNRVVTGGQSVLGTAPFAAQDVPHTQKLIVSGSSLELFIDGVSKVAVTDTVITGHKRTGIVGNTNNFMFADNFQAGDLATPIPVFMETYRRRRAMV